MSRPELLAWAVPGIGEISAGADLSETIATALLADKPLRDGDVIVVASKIIAKAEGRTVPASARDDAIDSESLHVVATRALADGRRTRVVHTRQGPVLAAAGVDASDVPDGTVLLLPADPDASAGRLRDGLVARLGVRLGVLITDTSGRPWRSGVTDFCLGAAGVQVLDDRRGSLDGAGRVLSVTIRNLADEIACAADLVKGKSAGTPVAVLRGVPVVSDTNSRARELARIGPSDWFRHGHVEAVRAALARPGHDTSAVPPPFIEPDVEALGTRLSRALRLALACPGAAQITAQQNQVDADATVVLTGPDYVLGRVAERLLTAAWAEDLNATEVSREPVGRERVSREPAQVTISVTTASATECGSEG